MSRRLLWGLGALGLLAMAATAVAMAAGPMFDNVKPQEFDPARTKLVQAAWLEGTGCPTGAGISSNGTSITGTYTDPACTTGDPKDKNNQGLLLFKTGPTNNYASATAELKQVPSTVTELGYDIRKAGPTSADTRGSHCGAGAPRFDIVTTDNADYFLGCNSPVSVNQTPGDGWLRLRWDGSTQVFPAAGGPTVALSTLDVKSITIVYDEGQDASGGPDSFGAAVLDNIDVNTTLVGQGPKDAD